MSVATTAPSTGTPRFAAGSPERRAAFAAAGILAVLVVALFVLPGRGPGGRGTPMAIVFQGAVLGLVHALTAAGIILIYRTIRVINFAQTAIGTAGAALCFQLLTLTGVPFVLAFPAGLLLAAAVGVGFDAIFGRRFFAAPRLVLTVLTIVAAGFISAVGASLVARLPFFPPIESRSLDQLLGATDLRSSLPFPGFRFTIGDFAIPFGFADLLAAELAIVVLVALGVFLRYTRAGVAVRAMAENTERAALLGISVGTLSSVIWGISGLLSGAGVTLTGILTSPQISLQFSPEVLLPALAAAVLAGLRSLPMAVVSSIGISIASQSLVWSFQKDRALVDLALFLVVAGGLLVGRKVVGRVQESAMASWQAAEEQRPIPPQLQAVAGVRAAYRALVLLGLLAAAVFPFVTTTGQTNLGSVITLTTIVAISLVVLTGWAGQVSLGQFAFAAVGAVVAGSLTGRVGVPFWFAVPIASIVTAGFAVLVGIPALRIRGLFLAVTTFAFAVAAGGMLFDDRYFGWLLPGAIERPSLLFLDFEDERSMYYLCLLCLVAAVAGVRNLRRSRFGRVLIAARENEQNLQSFGVSVLRAKLTGFAVAGALAGFAGALFAHQQRGLSAASFSAGASVDVFVIAVIGGISSVGGALLGSALINVIRYVITEPILQAFLAGTGTLAVLYAAPGGLVSLVGKARDAVLRIVAQRRRLVVPSLFEDADPSVLEHQLVPLSAPSAAAGLGALDAADRFAFTSELYTARSAARSNGDRESIRKAAQSVDAADAGPTRDAAGGEAS